MKTRLLTFLAMAMLVWPAGCLGHAPVAMPEINLVRLTDSDFAPNPDVTREVALPLDNPTLTVFLPTSVYLPTDPSFGSQWPRQATIDDTSVLQQVGNYYEPPPTTPHIFGVGEPEQWVFKALKPGTTAVFLAYSQPGAEKPARTFRLMVTVNAAP